MRRCARPNQPPAGPSSPRTARFIPSMTAYRAARGVSRDSRHAWWARSSSAAYSSIRPAIDAAIAASSRSSIPSRVSRSAAENASKASSQSHLAYASRPSSSSMASAYSRYSRPMAVTPETQSWARLFAARTRGDVGEGIAAILSLLGVPNLISFAGGLPDPQTFPRERAAKLLAEFAAAGEVSAFQYTPTRGLSGTLDAIAGRLEQLQGRRPADDELLITSGAIEALELVGKSFLDRGDLVVVEAPTYLGAIMAFRSFEAEIVAEPLEPRAGRGRTGGHDLEDVLSRGPPRLGGRAGRGLRAARLGEAEHRPVRRCAGTAALRGVRAPRMDRRAAGRVPIAVPPQVRAHARVARAVDAGGCALDPPAGRVLLVADAAERRGRPRSRQAGGRAWRRHRPGLAVLPRRPRRRQRAALVQPRRRGADRRRRGAARVGHGGVAPSVA